MKILLIVVREKRKWTKISRLINDEGVQYNTARNVKSGIEISPKTEEVSKKLHKMLQSEKAQFCTFNFKSEKIAQISAP